MQATDPVYGGIITMNARTVNYIKAIDSWMGAYHNPSALVWDFSCELLDFSNLQYHA